jgi:hypothetical protein
VSGSEGCGGQEAGCSFWQGSRRVGTSLSPYARGCSHAWGSAYMSWELYLQGGALTGGGHVRETWSALCRGPCLKQPWVLLGADRHAGRHACRSVHAREGAS